MFAGLGVKAFRPAPFQAGNPVGDRVKFTIKTAGSTVSTVMFVAAAIFTALLSTVTGFQITGFENARAWTWKNAQDSAFECKAHAYGIISPAGAEQMLADAAAAVAVAQPTAVSAKMQGLLKRVIEVTDDCLFKSILQSNEKGQIFKAAVAAMIGLSALTGGVEPVSAAILAVMPSIGLRNLGWQGTTLALGLAYNPALPKLAWEATKGLADRLQAGASYLQIVAAQIGDTSALLRGDSTPFDGGSGSALPLPVTMVAWVASWALAPFNFTASLAFSALGRGIAGLASNFWFPALTLGFQAVIMQPALMGAAVLDAVIYSAGFKSAQWWRPHCLVSNSVKAVISAPFTLSWIAIRKFIPHGKEVTDQISKTFNDIFNDGWGEALTIHNGTYRTRQAVEDVVNPYGQKAFFVSGEPRTRQVLQWQVRNPDGSWVSTVSPVLGNGVSPIGRSPWTSRTLVSADDFELPPVKDDEKGKK